MPKLATRINHFISELRRRRVFRVTIGYLVVAWMMIEASDLIMPELNLPDWAPRLVMALAILGLVPTIFLAWIFDITPQGVRRSEPLPDPGVGAEGGASAISSSSSTSKTHPGGRSHPSSALSLTSVLPRPLRFRRTHAEADALDGAAGNGSSEPEGGEASPLDPERLSRAVLAHHRHELRTPINAILGYSEMLIEDLADDGPADLVEALESIRSSGKALLEGIDGSMQPGAGVNDAAATAARLRENLRAPLDQVAAALRRAHTAAVAADRAEVAPDLERIRDAAAQLERLAGTPSGAPGEMAGLDASGFSEMAEEALRRIRPASGTDARGTTPSECLLVVDDSEMNRSLVARILAQRGYTVIMAADGEQALARIEERSYDLVLLDIMMPGINGIEVLRRMRAQPELQATPVVMMSALDEMDGVLRCIEMGAQDYLVKPLEPVLLRTRVEASLRLRRMHLRERGATDELRAERALADRLARGLFPEDVAERFLRGETDFAETHPDALALVVELDGLGRLSARSDPLEAASRRAAVRALLDDTVSALGVAPGQWADGSYRVVVSRPEGAGGASVAASAGLAIVGAVDAFATTNGVPLRARAGLHCGSVTAAVTGADRPLYEMWGDGIETAGGLAALAPAGGLVVSPTALARLGDGFDVENRGVVEVPKAGQMRVHLVRGPVLEPL